MTNTYDNAPHHLLISLMDCLEKLTSQHFAYSCNVRCFSIQDEHLFIILHTSDEFGIHHCAEDIISKEIITNLAFIISIFLNFR